MRSALGAITVALGLALSPAAICAPGPDASAARVHLIFDAAIGTTVRKTYRVWVPSANRTLDFEWIADAPSAKDTELVTGSGRLIWRERSAARALVSVYTGVMKDGRPHGQGALRARDGTRYEGAWTRGLYDGTGVLQMPDGSSYDGAFMAGKFEGHGVLVQADGEFYDGPFASGRKHGIGKTKLASGASYQSEWTRGTEVADSRRVRLAQGLQGGVLPVQFSDGDLRISFGTDVLAKNEDTGSPGDPIRYALRTTQSGSELAPDDQALMAAWNGTGLINEDFLGLKVGWPVAFNVRIKNTGAKAVNVRRAYLEIDESTADLRPFYSLWYAPKDSPCEGDNIETRLVFRDHGWSTLRSAKVEFAFSKDGSSAATPLMSASVRPRVATEESPMPPSGTIIYDFKAALSQLGVDLKRPLGDCRKISATACLDAAVKSKAFGKLTPALTVKNGALHVVMTGRLVTTWTDAKRQQKSSAAKFRLDVPFSRFVIPGVCAEAASPPEYDPGARTLVKLALGKTTYQAPLPFRRTLAPAQTAQIGLILDAGKSSLHRFRVALETDDGRLIRSRDVSLTVIWPSRTFFDYWGDWYGEE